MVEPPSNQPPLDDPAALVALAPPGAVRVDHNPGHYASPEGRDGRRDETASPSGRGGNAYSQASSSSGSTRAGACGPLPSLTAGSSPMSTRRRTVERETFRRSATSRMVRSGLWVSEV